MPDQNSGNHPSKNANTQPLSESPSLQSTSQHEMRDQSDVPRDKLDSTIKLESDIKKGEIALIAINFALLVVTIIIAKIYYGQLQEMRKATEATAQAAHAAQESADLSRQQAIALQQAVVRMSVSDFVLESPTLQPALPIGFRNEGIAIATGVSFHGAFNWKSEPLHVTFGQPTPINIEIPSMPQGDKGAKGYMVTIPELNPDVLKVIRRSTKAKTIELSGKFTYSNGFNQTMSEDICKVYFAREQLGNVLNTGFIDCDQYAAKVKLWQNLEREHPQH